MNPFGTPSLPFPSLPSPCPKERLGVIKQSREMQFPQINKYESLIERHLRPSYDPLHALSFDAEPLPRVQLAEILNDIEEINLARSYHPPPPLARAPPTPASPPAVKSSGSEETLECDLTFLSERKPRRHAGRSLIFSQGNFSKNKEARPGERAVRVFFFNLPASRLLPYLPTTTVAELTRAALDAYSQDRQFDAARLKDRAPQNYELRIPQAEGSHEADTSIEPISPARLLADNLFESLVLLRKEQPSARRTPFQHLPAPASSGTALIVLFNELGEQLGQVAMARTDSLEKVFTYIETNDLHQMRNFFLTENQNDEDPLPKDFEIKNLESNRIYIKSKRYIDESEFDGGNRAKIIRSLTLFKEKEGKGKGGKGEGVEGEREERVASLASSLPIGLSEASLYEEFAVVKVNNLGAEQERIMGIDQHKVYNYDRAVREEKRQTSFLSKIFGVNRDTGTKRPYRFIADIQQLTPTERGFQVVFPDKTIRYIVPAQDARERILRKLNYLVAYTQGQRRSEPKP